MLKALATHGSGPSARLLALALPGFRDYASLHGYDVVIGSGDAQGRSASWGKVPLFQRLLTRYDFVLWIDADALILDASLDLEPIVPADAFQAFVVAELAPGRGIAPSMGVWALRAGTRTQRFLTEVWHQDDLVSHRLWEQAAVMRLLGWTTELPFSKERSSEWDDGTHVLAANGKLILNWQERGNGRLGQVHVELKFGVRDVANFAVIVPEEPCPESVPDEALESCDGVSALRFHRGFELTPPPALP